MKNTEMPCTEINGHLHQRRILNHGKSIHSLESCNKYDFKTLRRQGGGMLKSEHGIKVFDINKATIQ